MQRYALLTLETHRTAEALVPVVYFLRLHNGIVLLPINGEQFEDNIT